MVFQGSLAELHLPDIIQLVSVSGKTGVFHLIDGNARGQIFLNDGRIVHAQLEEATGEEAVYALAIWRQGEFRFEPGAATEVQTISKSNTNLLMEAARRFDEWRVLSKKIPSVDLVPEFVVLDNREGQINLNTSEWLILSKIDGQRTVKGIAGGGEPLGLRCCEDALRSRGHGPHPPARGGGQAEPARPAAAARAAGRSARGGSSGAGRAQPRLRRRRASSRGPPATCRARSSASARPARRSSAPWARAWWPSTTRRPGPSSTAGPAWRSSRRPVHQIARAAAILKGPSASDAVLELLKGLK